MCRSTSARRTTSSHGCRRARRGQDRPGLRCCGPGAPVGDGSRWSGCTGGPTDRHRTDPTGERGGAVGHVLAPCGRGANGHPGGGGGLPLEVAHRDWHDYRAGQTCPVAGTGWRRPWTSCRVLISQVDWRWATAHCSGALSSRGSTRSMPHAAPQPCSTARRIDSTSSCLADKPCSSTSRPWGVGATRMGPGPPGGGGGRPLSRRP